MRKLSLMNKYSMILLAFLAKAYTAHLIKLMILLQIMEIMLQIGFFILKIYFLLKKMNLIIMCAREWDMKIISGDRQLQIE